MVDTPPEGTEQPQIVNLSQVNIESVQTGLARAVQTNIKQLNAEEAELQTSMAGRIQANELHARNSLIGLINSSQATIVDSFAVGINAESLNFNGVVALAAADTMTNKDVNAIAVIGADIQAENINTGILIGSEIHGNVTTTLDSQTAIMVAAVGGAVVGLVLLAGKLLFGNKK